VPNVDLMDETFVVASRRAVSDALHDPKLWRDWWPDLDLVVENDRGLNGLQFSVTGGLVGSGELWLEAWGDGVIVHVFLRADPTRPGSATEPATLKLRQIWREARKRAWQTKRGMGRLKDDLEAGRAAGEPGAEPEPAESSSGAASPGTASPDTASPETASPGTPAASEASAPEAVDVVSESAEVSTTAAAGGGGAGAAAGTTAVGVSRGRTAG
jgi:hypothetical protein